MEKWNDFFVLQCSYSLFLFSDYVPIEKKTIFGWMYNAYVVIMLASNIVLLIGTSVMNFVRNCKKCRMEQMYI